MLPCAHLRKALLPVPFCREALRVKHLARLPETRSPFDRITAAPRGRLRGGGSEGTAPPTRRSPASRPSSIELDVVPHQQKQV